MIFVVIWEIFFSRQNQLLNNVVWAITSITFAMIILYTFIIKPLASQQTGTYSGFFSRSRDSFKPYTRPPSKLKKKTQLGGHCGSCNVQISFGFTCSYCNNYFCPEHRLPEKHGCPGVKK
jgi:hypothetical protein